MELFDFFKSVLEQDRDPVVLCDKEHTIVYMNPSAMDHYQKRGGAALLGSNLLDCHNAASNERIRQVVAWFAQSPEHNLVYTFHNERENKDVYMVALRDSDHSLIGYYEKHESRNQETAQRYHCLSSDPADQEAKEFTV
jgi:PAS domain-containing protein